MVADFVLLIMVNVVFIFYPLCTMYSAVYIPQYAYSADCNNFFLKNKIRKIKFDFLKSD